MSISPDAPPPADESDLPTRTFGPPAPVVIGTLAVGAVFLVVLEFLVIISFVGQSLWRDPRLMHELWFSLPLIVWVLMAALVTVVCLRVLTSWLHLDEDGFVLRSLFRRPRAVRWEEVGCVIAARGLEHDTSEGQTPPVPETTYDGVYVMDPRGRRMLAVSSRFFGPRAQEMTLHRARGAGVRIEHIDAITPAALREQAPRAMSFVDRHPTPLVIVLLLFYIAHNLLTFVIWGL